MPVTSRLSQALTDKLGNELANELVNWLNDVDSAYRAQIRELNDLNFARFDARIGERLAELRAELRGEMADLRANLGDQIRDAKVSTIRWMFGFWVGTGVMVLGWFVTRWVTTQ